MTRLFKAPPDFQFLVASPILVKLIFLCFGSSLTLSILTGSVPSTFDLHVHVKLRLVVFSLHPLHTSKPCKSSLLDLFYHRFLSPQIFSCFLISKFFLLLLPLILLNQLISAT